MPTGCQLAADLVALLATSVRVPWKNSRRWISKSPPEPTARQTPNQIVHVVAKAPFECDGTFEAVTVTGLMNVKQMKKNLYLVDGSADIKMSYALAADSVLKFKNSK